MNTLPLSECLIALALLQVTIAPTAAAQSQGASPFPIERVTGPQLLAFDGIWELVGTSGRLGMLTQVLDYTIKVGADGKPTDCALSRKFRSPSVERQLCDILMRQSRFQPAVDATGNLVAGTYHGRIDFRSFIKPDR